MTSGLLSARMHGGRRRAAALALSLLAVASLALGADAAPDPWPDACLIRPEAAPPAGQTMSPPPPMQSTLGWRRARSRLFDVSLTLVDGNAVCSIGGVARLRDDGTLVFPIRPDATTPNRAAGPCLVTLRTAGSAVEVATSPACQAEAVCGGRIALQGQRFELARSAAPDAGGPCFEPPAARR